MMFLLCRGGSDSLNSSSGHWTSSAEVRSKAFAAGALHFLIIYIYIYTYIVIRPPVCRTVVSLRSDLRKDFCLPKAHKKCSGRCWQHVKTLLTSVTPTNLPLQVRLGKGNENII